MFKDYHFLNRCIIELNKEISGAKILEAYTQEKNKLYLAIPCDEHPFRHLIISTNPQSPYILIKSQHNKAKKNFTNFFEDVFPTNLKRLLIADDDRIIEFRLEKSSIVLKIAGNNTNVYSIRNNKIISSFKKEDSLSKLEEEITSKKFIDHPNTEINLPGITDEMSYRDFKQSFPFISRTFYNEIHSRLENKIHQKIDDAIRNIVNDIFDADISVGIGESNDKTNFQPSTFAQSQLQNNETFSTYNDALLYYLGFTHKTKNFTKLKSQLLNSLSKEREYISSKLNKLKSRIERGSRDDEYYQIANLLSANRNKIKKGMEEIELIDLTNSGLVKIKLNHDHDANQAIDYYFNKAKDEKINFRHSERMYKEAKSKFSEILNAIDKIEQAEDLQTIREFRKKFMTDDDKAATSINHEIKYKEYRIDGKYTVLVGKDSKNNDLMTFKLAKQNDYWFHARGYAGSHVVLRVDNPKHGVPKNVLNAAASIAAFYSKGKTSNLAPVAYTLRKFVRKSKGMAPGKVIISKEKVLLVKPQIPKNCELIGKDEE